jgi:peptidoglycan/LPS O-acetylase OafA/YrhL
MILKSDTLAETTDTLKGIAISAVLINHYLNINVSGNQSGFANQWIYLFFVISGYGLSHSLKKRFSAGISLTLLMQYYFSRFIRIFPLLWVAFFLTLWITNRNLSYWNLTGIHGSGFFWFIPAIVHCYLVAPLVHMAMRKHRMSFLLLPILVFVVINVLFKIPNINDEILDFFSFTHARLRGIYYPHVLFFVFGFYIHKALQKKIRSNITPTSIGAHSVFYLMLMGILIFMIIAKHYIFVLPEKLLPLATLPLLAYFALNYNIKNRIFAFLGSISYSIYLFHMSFYLLLSNLGKFPVNSLSELIVCLILFPIFLYICTYTEKLGQLVCIKFQQHTRVQK